jgi:hypothetical protein
MTENFGTIDEGMLDAVSGGSACCAESHCAPACSPCGEKRNPFDCFGKAFGLIGKAFDWNWNCGPKHC